MINGALTIGTLDGANVGPPTRSVENFFLFNDEVTAVKASGCAESYLTCCAGSDSWRRMFLAPGHRNVPTVGGLHADFASYAACQDQVQRAWQDSDSWTKMSILNTAQLLVLVGSRHRLIATTSGRSVARPSMSSQHRGMVRSDETRARGVQDGHLRPRVAAARRRHLVLAGHVGGEVSHPGRGCRSQVVHQRSEHLGVPVRECPAGNQTSTST